MSDKQTPERPSEDLEKRAKVRTEEEAVAAFLREESPSEETPQAEASEEAAAAFLRDQKPDSGPAEAAARAESEEKHALRAEAQGEEGAPAEPEAEEVPPPEPEIDDGIERRWYAIHAHSGQELNVQKSLRAISEQGDLKGLISNVLVPMEEVTEFKSGEKRLSKRKYFPGYVLAKLPVHPEQNPDLWHSVKNTPGVTGFIGSRTVPVPLEDAEVEGLLQEIRGERERPRPKVLYESGERVKIIDGPFSNFMGNIDEVNEERGKLKIMIEIFERLTSVEVEFWQVDKI